MANRITTDINWARKGDDSAEQPLSAMVARQKLDLYQLRPGGERDLLEGKSARPGSTKHDLRKRTYEAQGLMRQ